MDFLLFQNKVIGFLDSKSLQKAIVNNNFVFTEIELFKIIIKYVEKFDDRLA